MSKFNKIANSALISLSAVGMVLFTLLGIISIVKTSHGLSDRTSGCPGHCDELPRQVSLMDGIPVTMSDQDSPGRAPLSEIIQGYSSPMEIETQYATGIGKPDRCNRAQKGMFLNPQSNSASVLKSMDLGESLGTSKVSDVRRRGAMPEAYE
jgi:hypothetical protein